MKGEWMEGCEGEEGREEEEGGGIRGRKSEGE